MIDVIAENRSCPLKPAGEAPSPLRRRRIRSIDLWGGQRRNL